MSKSAPSKEQSFKDAYAKKLADALLENEKTQRSQILSPSLPQTFTKQEIDDAYLALCFDDPVLKNDAICRQLALQLLSPFPYSARTDAGAGISKGAKRVMKKFQSQNGGQSDIGLSDRFVDGVKQTTSNSRTAGKSASPPVAGLGGDDDFTKSYNGEQIIPAASASKGYTELAFVSFAKGPLHCCNALLNLVRNENEICDGNDAVDNLKAARSFLGTYTGNGSDAQENGGNDVEGATDAFLESMTDQQNLEGNETDAIVTDISNGRIDNDYGKEDDSMKEIFAADSDPDDFDFGDDRYSSQNDSVPAEFQSLSQLLNVESLCETKLLTMPEISFRVKSLISELSYRRITMSTKSWRELDVSDTLVQLTLQLLHCFGNDDLDNLGILFSAPLNSLRDRALDGSYGHDALDAYLDLIRKLLTSQTEDVGISASSNCEKSKELSPARAIGLSSLASLCMSHDFSGTSKKNERMKIRSVIMECLDALVDSVEFVRPKKKESNLLTLSSLPVWVRPAIALSQIGMFITGVKSGSDFSAVEDSALATPISNSEAQSILQSGFFREIILLYAQTLSQDDISEPQESENAADVARRLILRQLFVLSAQSQILAKYVSRVPELTNILYLESFRAQNTIDPILWYSLLSKMKTSSKGQLIMKGAVSMSSKDLKEKCASIFLKLCERCTHALTDDTNNVRVLFDFICFSNCLRQIPFIADCWIEVISEMGTEKETKDALKMVMKSLSKLKSPVTPDDREKSGKDDRKDGKPRASYEGIDTNMKASLRKGCKSLLLDLENMADSKLPRISTRISSKTD